MFTRALRLAGAPLAGIVLAVAVIAGCNDDPTGIGAGYLPENVRFATYRATASDFEIFSGSAAISNSSSRGGGAMLVGRADDGTVAHALIAVSDSIRRMEGPNPAQPQSVTLRLRAYPYRFGQPGDGQTSFDVVSIDEVALDTARWNPGIVGKIESAELLGTFTGSHSDSAFIAIPLDVAAATRFLREFYTYDTTVTLAGSSPDTVVTLRVRRSLVLRARNDAKNVVAFVGSRDVDSLRPTLEVAFGDATVQLRAGVSSWIADLPVETGPGQLVIAGGEPIRTFVGLRINLPRGATIHQAQLKLHVDTARSRHGSLGPTTTALLMDGDASSRLPDSYLLRASSGRYYVGFRSARDSASFTDVFVFGAPAPSLTQNLRTRAAGGDSTAALILALDRGLFSAEELETASVDRLQFHGFDAADAALRPELTIIYSTQTDAP